MGAAVGRLYACSLGYKLLQHSELRVQLRFEEVFGVRTESKAIGLVVLPGYVAMGAEE